MLRCLRTTAGPRGIRRLLIYLRRLMAGVRAAAVETAMLRLGWALLVTAAAMPCLVVGDDAKLDCVTDDMTPSSASSSANEGSAATMPVRSLLALKSAKRD